VSDSGLMQNVVRNAEEDGREAYLRNSSLSPGEAEEVLRARAMSRLEETKEGAPGAPVPASGPVEEDK